MIRYIVGRNLGHLCRSVANVQKWQEKNNKKVPVEVHAFKHAHQWLRKNLPETKIKAFNKEAFQKYSKLFLKADLIMHDWRKEVAMLKNARGKQGPIIGGVYHSDLFVNGDDSDWTARFKEEVHEISEKTTDVFFHMNLTQPERIPKLSTFYLPIPIISRELTLSPRKVKEMLGMAVDEPFVLIHMGGGMGPFRYKYMEEWFEKIKELKTNYKIVVASQFGEVIGKFPKQIIQAPLFGNGSDLIYAADLVISKPGMGIMIDCIATGTPLLALPADTKERQVKNMMLRDLIGSDLCLVPHQATAKELSRQIDWVAALSSQIQAIFQQIPKNGAEVVAECMKLLSRHRLKELPDLYPRLQTLTPFSVNE
ncbi:hypothetical protein [Ammoniphilus resinae]|uniref:Glycosyltransferase n=1 Tax=Ammoniphilus resinae TaxID=861532 RepID=A0ABS4GRS2_9BACL|nr:hypothetical protein [Ammoniphilus resinae]MBP1932978.1 hypothetical protein [Ammoniphilus resinae]